MHDARVACRVFSSMHQKRYKMLLGPGAVAAAATLETKAMDVRGRTEVVVKFLRQLYICGSSTWEHESLGRRAPGVGLEWRANGNERRSVLVPLRRVKGMYLCLLVLDLLTSLARLASDTCELWIYLPGYLLCHDVFVAVWFCRGAVLRQAPLGSGNGSSRDTTRPS